MLSLINDARAGRNLPPLAHNAQLAEAAVRHARDLASGRVDLGNSHAGSDGSTVVQRVTAAGYPVADCREMTGWNTWGSAEWQVDYWLNSAVHQPIIYSGDLPDVGIGYVYQPGSAWGHYWTVVMARPSTPSQPAPPSSTIYVPVVVGRPVAPPVGYALIDYLRGDGRAYMVRHPSGASEKFRTVDLGGDRWLILKNSQWEELWLADGYIWRGVDTSPGDGQYYRQFEDGRTGARWAPARMSLGESWAAPGTHTVQTYWKGDCQPVDHHRNGRTTNRLTLAAHYDRMTINGVELVDVIELRTHTAEGMFFARGWGLVAWRSGWGSSEIVHALPPHEWDNEPEVGCFGP